MNDIKSKAQGIDPNVKARDIRDLAQSTGNIYEVLAVVSKRSNQIAVDLKRELTQKLEEFAISSDAIEEINENKEQIEISKFYERLPNPSVIALEEYLNEETHYHYSDKKRRR